MTEVQARQRFIIMNMLRLTGVFVALFGLAIIAGKLDLPREVGYVAFVVGLFDAMLLPPLLARRWKSPPQP